MTDALSVGEESNVVLIGCHTFTELTELPAVADNLSGLKDALLDPKVWGVPEDRIHVLAQPTNGDDVIDVVLNAASHASDTLVVYYAGHGLIDPSTGELYLALADSRMRDILVQRALRFEELRRVILTSGAQKKAVLIDCCYSGRALPETMGAGIVSPLDNAMIEGTCVTTATSATAQALAPAGEKFTAFTGALIRTLTQGVPGAGALLDMERLYHAVNAQLLSQCRPLPQQMNRNTAGRICIARNRAHRASAPSPPPREQPRPPRRPQVSTGVEPSQVRIFSTTGQITGSGVLVAPDALCTCAHVVTNALGLPVDAHTVPDRPVQLDFPLLPDRPTAVARVESWRPDDDVALLRLDHTVEGSMPAPLVDGPNVWGDTFRALGFPQHFDGGVWVSGKLRGHTGSGWLQAETSSNSHRVREGFSGSPVWDDALGGVVGMLVAADRTEGTAFVLRSADLVDLDTWVQPHPFPGLAPFTEDDATVFHGRDADADRVREAVRRQPLTLVTGPSGCGKTSLVRAGVLAGLRAEGVCVAAWSPSVGRAPLHGLALELTHSLEPELEESEQRARAEELARELESDSRARDALRARLEGCDTHPRLVLFIDGLEHYAAAQPAEAKQLFTLLLSMSVPEAVTGLRIVATARLDALDLLTSPDTEHRVRHAVQPLGPLTTEALMQAITAPLKTVPGVEFEPGLPERIIADVGDEPGRTALVAYVLAELWKWRSASMVLHTAYDALNAAPGALVALADAQLGHLDDGQSALARRLFLQLAQPGDGDTFVRRTVRAGDVTPEVMEVARTLAFGRLVVVSHTRDRSGVVTTVDLAHEALIRLCPPVRQWLVESREFRRWQEALRAEINRWESRDRASDSLLRGGGLAAADSYVDTNRELTTAKERDFITLSRRAQRRLRHVLAVAGAATVVSVVAAFLSQIL
ncbi:serine protease [Streptomyces sp. NPDC050844]|uniref:serine protease n=1 Tax=Streptomyces sp. NPDC050844 TaxID=3155790 RepID=UPI0033F11279